MQTVRVEHGCGCGTLLAVLLLVGFAQLGAEWVGAHPLPAALIGAGLAVLVVGGLMLWRDGQARRPVVLAPEPTGFCPRCGAERTAGQRFCGDCGAPLP